MFYQPIHPFCPPPSPDFVALQQHPNVSSSLPSVTTVDIPVAAVCLCLEHKHMLLFEHLWKWLLNVDVIGTSL